MWFGLFYICKFLLHLKRNKLEITIYLCFGSYETKKLKLQPNEKMSALIKKMSEWSTFV